MPIDHSHLGFKHVDQADPQEFGKTLLWELIGGSPAERENLISGPQGFRVQFPPQRDERAHYHDSDQFQVFFPSAGAYFQRSSLNGVLVQYADRFTTYGPFGSGSEPLTFYTLRRNGAAVKGYPPEDRPPESSSKVRQRRATVPWFVERSDHEEETASEVVLFEELDGLVAYIVRIPRGQRFGTVGPSRNEGYCLVLAGSVDNGESEHPDQSVAWFGPGSSLGDLTSLTDEAIVLVMQFPRVEVPTG